MSIQINLEQLFNQRWRDESAPFVVPNSVSTADLQAALDNVSFGSGVGGSTIGAALVWNGIDWTNTKLDATGLVSALSLILQTGTAAPTSAAHIRGEIVWNSAPSAAGNVGWSCVTSGTPGTWKTFGTIAS